LFASSVLPASEVRVWIDAAEVDLFDTSHAILTVPADLAGKDVVDLRAANGVLMALTADKRVYLWGSANGTSGILNVPPAVQGHVVAIATGLATAFVVLDSGAVITWGDTSAQVGSLTPTATNFVAVGQGIHSGVSWNNAGSPIAWGDVMEPIPNGTLVAQAIAVRDRIVYRRLSDNQVLASGSMVEYPALTPPVPAITATQLSVSKNIKAMFAITPSKSVVGWGNSTNDILPVPSDLTGVTQVEAGNTQAIVRLNSGGTRIWGTGSSGTWTIPANLIHVRRVAAGYGFCAALISRAPSAVAWNDGGTVVANALVGTAIGTLKATDPDSQDTQFTYHLVSGEGDAQNSLVSISGAMVSVAGALPQGAATMTIRVRVTDSSGATFETPLAIQRSAAPDQGSDNNAGILSCGVGGGISLILAAFLVLFARLRWRS
jgi:hypothetical protein